MDQNSKKELVMVRLKFFAEIVIIFLVLSLLLFIPRFLLPLIMEENSLFLEPLSYLMRAMMMLVGIPLALFISNLVISSMDKEVILEEDITPSSSFLKLFKITKKNFKYQLLYGILLFFLLFLPMDLLMYLIPGVLEFQADYLMSGTSSDYLTQPYLVFIGSVIIIHISVSITEETLARGLISKYGSQRIKMMSAVVISSLYFGYMHWVVIFTLGEFSWYPFLYLGLAFFIGVSLSLFVVKKNWIFPVIMAHAMNNIVSAHAIWNHLQGNAFLPFVLSVYIPLLLISVILFILQFKRIKEGLKTGLKEFKTYFQVGEEEEGTGDLLLRFAIDIGIAFLIFFLGLLLAVG